MQVVALSIFMNLRWSQDLLVKKFLLVEERVTPINLKYFSPWGLSKVLDALTRQPFEPKIFDTQNCIFIGHHYSQENRGFLDPIYQETFLAGQGHTETR